MQSRILAVLITGSLSTACAIDLEEVEDTEDTGEITSELGEEPTVVFANDFSVSADGFTPASGTWSIKSYGTGTGYYQGEGGSLTLPIISTTTLAALAPTTTLETAAFFGNTITSLKAQIFMAGYLVYDVVDHRNFKWVRLWKRTSAMNCEIGEHINGTQHVRRTKTCVAKYTSNVPVPMMATLSGKTVVFTVNGGTDVMYYTYADPIDRVRVGVGATSRGALDYFNVEQ